MLSLDRSLRSSSAEQAVTSGRSHLVASVCARIRLPEQQPRRATQTRSRRESIAVHALAGTQDRAQACRLPVSHERVLRYPDGKERRILYPVVDESESCEEFCDTCPDDTWEKDHPSEVVGFWLQDSTGASFKAQQEQQQDEVSPVAPRPSSFTGQPQQEHVAAASFATLPSSPADLLRYLRSDEYKRAQQATWERVCSSYKVLYGCPWVLPRPLYVLAAAQKGSSAGSTYTLRTRISRQEEEDQLTKLLKRTRPDGSAVIRVERIVEGVVAFEAQEEAAEYATMLEADGYDAVSIMEVASHDLFRTTNEVQACVVLLLPHDERGGADLPQPEMLAASLRGKQEDI